MKKEEEGVEDIFLDQCDDLFKDTIRGKEVIENKTFFSMFFPQDKDQSTDEDTNDGLSKLRRGFIEKGDDIFIVYDYAELSTANLRGAWVTLSEILDRKTVFNINIDPLAIELIGGSRVLSNIKNSDNENLPRPLVLYLCKKTSDGVMQNAYYEGAEDTHTTVTIINERVNHPILRQVYMFTDTIFNSDNDITKIKRFAVYFDPSKKIKGELTENVPEDAVIGFQENNVNYWCTKSPVYFVEL